MNNRIYALEQMPKATGKMRTVEAYTEDAIANADKLSRETFKAIKHMNKIELASFLDDVYRSGYKAGYEACQKSQQKKEESEHG